MALYVGATGRWPFGTADATSDKAFRGFLEVSGQVGGAAASQQTTAAEAVRHAADPTRWRWPRTMGDGLREVVQLCLQIEPERRPSAEQLLNHPWFQT